MLIMLEHIRQQKKLLKKFSFQNFYQVKIIEVIENTNNYQRKATNVDFKIGQKILLYN